MLVEEGIPQISNNVEGEARQGHLFFYEIPQQQATYIDWCNPPVGDKQYVIGWKMHSAQLHGQKRMIEQKNLITVCKILQGNEWDISHQCFISGE